VNGNVMALLESDSIELIGRVKDAVLEHAVEFEIGFHLRIVDVVASFSDLLRIELPVVGLDLETAFLRVNDGLDIGGLASGLGGCGGGGGIPEMQPRVRRFWPLIV